MWKRLRAAAARLRWNPWGWKPPEPDAADARRFPVRQYEWREAFAKDGRCPDCGAPLFYASCKGCLIRFDHLTEDGL